MTRRLRRFWQTLESVPGHEQVTEAWRRMLGDEHNAVAHFLRPTNRRVSEYPCPSPGGEGCPRRIVDHGDSDVVAVCGDTPKRCDRVALTASDIVIHEVDLPRLGREVAHALSIAPVPSFTISREGAGSLGTVSTPTGDHRPVHLALPLSGTDFRRVVTSLVASATHPFVLLTAVSRHHGTNATEVLRKHGSRYFALEELLTLSDDGTLTAARSITELVSPGPTAEDHLAFVFRREGDIWEIRFDGEPTKLRDSKGLRCMHVLLQNPNRDYHPMDLEQTATPPLPTAPKSHPDADLSRPGGLGPAIDSQTKNELRNRLKEIDEGLAVAKRNQDLGTTEAVIRHLATEDRWYVFRAAADAFTKAYAALTPDPRVLPYRVDLKFVGAVIPYGKLHFEQIEETDWKVYSEKVRAMLDEHLEVTGLKTVCKLRDLTDPDFWGDFEAPVDLETAAVRKLAELKKETTERASKNAARYERFSDRIKELIERFNEGLLTAEEILAATQEVAEAVRAEDQAHVESGLNARAYGVAKILESFRVVPEEIGEIGEDTSSVWDGGGEPSSKLSPAQRVAAEIDALYASDEVAPPYWQEKSQLKKEIRRQVRRLVRPLGLDGWQNRIPRDVEHFAVHHYAKP